MKKALIVIDMQNDFVTGSLGTREAEAIVEPARKKIGKCIGEGYTIFFTRDTHGEKYLETKEGKKLPIVHCVKGTKGWEIADALAAFVPQAACVFDKSTFGSAAMTHAVSAQGFDEIELIGLCTDICVVSNALLLKAAMPEKEIIVDASCCAGVTKKSHEEALNTMEMCQITVSR